MLRFIRNWLGHTIADFLIYSYYNPSYYGCEFTLVEHTNMPVIMADS